MKWILNTALLLVLISNPLWAAQCETITVELDLPVKAKTRGKPRIIRWELVDKTMDRLDKLEDAEPGCRMTFSQVFRNDRDDIYLPLTNTLIRLAPEGTFNGLKFYSRDGVEQGTYEQRVEYEKTGGLYARRSYKIYIFQYTTPSGRLMKVGPQLLLDNFIIKWDDVKDRIAYTSDREEF